MGGTPTVLVNFSANAERDRHASFAILRFFAHRARWLSPLAQKMMARLMGLLLCAMSIQFTINALRQMGVPLNL